MEVIRSTVSEGEGIVTKQESSSRRRPLNLIYKPKRQTKVVIIGYDSNLYKQFYDLCTTTFDQVVRYGEVDTTFTYLQFQKELVASDFVIVLDTNYELNRITWLRNSNKVHLFLPFDYDNSDIWIEELALTFLKIQQVHKSINLDEGYLSKDTSSLNSYEGTLSNPPDLIPNRMYLVGAGPGNPELLTLQAQRLISTCDVLLVDKLIGKPLLQSARPDCIIKYSNKYLGNATQAQEQLNLWGQTYLNQSKLVVRLKGGDPFLFGRSGEEIQFYQSLGYQVHLVPGISSLLAGPTLNHLPLTLRHSTNQLLLLTATTFDLKLIDLPKYKVNRNLCFAMFAHQLERLLLEFTRMGYPDQCQLAILSQVSLPEMKCQLFSLQELRKCYPTVNIPKPAMLMVGRHLDCLL